jgi:DNA-binding LacI/PurR family transcriptional regulator
MLADKNPASLKTVAARVGLAPCSISAVLNNTPASRAIPQATKDRIFRAVAELNYRPNLWARSLRTKRTRMVAAATPDVGRPAVARVIAGLQSRLHRRGYLLALVNMDSIGASSACVLLQQRGIEGVIAIDASLPEKTDLPIASVDLSYINSADVFSEDMQAWLSELGASAAETMIRQIEKPNASRRVKIQPKLPPAYFGAVRTGLVSSETRESA